MARLTEDELKFAIHQKSVGRELTRTEKQVKSLYSRGLSIPTIMTALGLRSSQVLDILGLDLDDNEIHKLGELDGRQRI